MFPKAPPTKTRSPRAAHKAFDVTLAGNKCYTIIAFSPPGNISDVDLHLLVPPFYNMDAGHDDMNEQRRRHRQSPRADLPVHADPHPLSRRRLRETGPRPGRGAGLLQEQVSRRNLADF